MATTQRSLKAAIRLLAPAGLALLLMLTTGCSSRPRYRTEPSAPTGPKRPSEMPSSPRESGGPEAADTRGAYQVGTASYYAHKFHGRPTANGEIFDMNGLSAAHRELPLGTWIRVTHLGNGRKVEVKVNDRGPFVGDRVLDLSLGAARALDMVEEGVARIRIDIIRSVE